MQYSEINVGVAIEFVVPMKLAFATLGALQKLHFRQEKEYQELGIISKNNR